jgi:hypothetical protein
VPRQPKTLSSSPQGRKHRQDRIQEKKSYKTPFRYSSIRRCASALLPPALSNFPQILIHHHAETPTPPPPSSQASPRIHLRFSPRCCRRERGAGRRRRRPMALSAGDVQFIYSVLANSLSADAATRQPAEALLAQCEARQGFCSCLLVSPPPLFPSASLLHPTSRRPADFGLI